MTMRMRKAPATTEAAPYSALAEIYDSVMSHVNYRRWAEYIHELVQRYHPQAHWLVDLSCGTGTCCFYLQKLGYRVHGMDLSEAMIRQARKKYSSSRIRDVFFCSDMVRPPLRNGPDVVISLYDSMNYITTPHRWIECLSRVYQCLAANGIFIFDVSTVFNSRVHFSDYEEEHRFFGASYKRISSFLPKKSVQINRFEIKFDNRKEVYSENHRQVIRYLAEIDDFIARTAFKKEAAFRDYTFLPAVEECERVHYVLRRKDDRVE